ncbi:hypothetical protein [Prevotella sp. HJM029]|uniref:hypothetical protein n=1 Tax=Prevotella sp. HJM029 TaxID=1433844 RepID=UPI0012DE765D|nr:hypothetical protein [Prevotella sp. HJM029]
MPSHLWGDSSWWYCLYIVLSRIIPMLWYDDEWTMMRQPHRGCTLDSPGLPTIGGYPGEQGVWDATPLGVVLFVNGTITPNG